jgi:rSAM/selenodomain-associated transferase 1
MVGRPQANVIGVLTRAPSRGGKSRLFAALGRPFDTALLSALLLDTLDATGIPGTDRVVAVAPADGCDEVRAMLPEAIEVVAQTGDPLGERMASLMRLLLDRGASRVVLIGSDLPALTAAPIHEAFASLERDPEAIVLGPAVDGGYYLIGATTVPDLFGGIEWGSARVLDQTRQAAARAGRRVHLLQPAADVDTVEDLVRLPAGVAPRTAQWARLNGIVTSRGSVTADGAV